MYDEDGEFIGDIGEFDPNDCTAEELAELEIIFGHPIVADKDVDEVIEEAVKDVKEVEGIEDVSTF